MNKDETAQAVALAVLEERARCVAEVCDYCNIGNPPEFRLGLVKHRREDGRLVSCKAGRIHMRVKRSQPADN